MRIWRDDPTYSTINVTDTHQRLDKIRLASASITGDHAEAMGLDHLQCPYRVEIVHLSRNMRKRYVHCTAVGADV